jgi:hypothetical protein
MLESARTRENRRRAREAREPSQEEGAAFRAARRARNEQKAAGKPASDHEALVEFECECVKGDCERTLRVPLYVYRRMLEAGDQYLLQTGHHPSARYRTIVTFGVTSIEEEA